MTCTTILCLTAALFAQVKLELFPQPAPVQLQMFPASEPVTLKLFPEPAKHGVEDPEKQLVPPPIEGPPAAPKLPVVWVYKTASCARCVVAEREYRDALNRGALLPYVWKHDAAIPAWVETFPTFHFKGRDGWKKIEGWNGLDDFNRRFDLATRKQARQETRVAIPHPTNRWTYPGRIDQHLLREHGYTGSLEGLSQQEMERIHGALHEGLIQPRQETRSRFRRKLQSTRHVASMQPKRFDPFLVMSIISIVLDLSKVFCPNR